MQPWKISVGFTVIIIAVAAMMGGERFAYLEPHFRVIFPLHWTGLAWHGGLAIVTLMAVIYAAARALGLADLGLKVDLMERSIRRGGGSVDDPPSAEDKGAAALKQALDSMHTATSGLEDEIAAEAQADQAFIAAIRGTPATPETAPAVPAATAATATAQDYSVPARLEVPQDPPGWERIYEGSFLEAALVTQLTGDFPGPVLAVVAIPFYSADRQRILVPRGTRIIGTSQAVTNQDQARLGIGFHRLIFPDGSWVSLRFLGLNQLGEGALKDQINRHYFSMFAAVGAVGVLSGLTAAGGNPYQGGTASMRSGAGQGLGQAATRILDRFLNRLPNITIRAGHRLRVWFTSDVLVLRPTKGD